MADTQVDLSTEPAISDDEEVALALLATEHPDLKRFGKVVSEHVRETNRLQKVCAPWQEAASFPSETLETYRSVQVTASALLKEVEKLDSIDLDDLKPGWGDKATVRMARKAVIGFSQKILDRLDKIQAVLAAPAAKCKQDQADAAKAKAAEAQAKGNSDKELSFQEKYRDLLQKKEEPAPTSGRDGPPPAKRAKKGKEPASKAEVEALLKEIRGKAARSVVRQPMRSFYKKMLNFSSVADLPNNQSMCKEAVELVMNCGYCALEAKPSSKALTKLYNALLQLDRMKDPTGLPGVLLDMADAVRGLD
eukprot:TRINITY_DN83616_c0_g1_i1.p1 TRINITY_DN83616_c0_g1~~TRINITY_DN83616_c0_g1_i1.p1  ORF type:complete len:307 (-),score=94.48 TRINITY_DN83616_c0_g1_i1:142-1062(-)